MTAYAVSLQTVLLLAASNVFMTFAWYGHLKNLAHKPWYAAELISWGIALLEYLLQVPANRIGFNLDSAVERARAGCDAVRWQGATTRRA